MAPTCTNRIAWANTDSQLAEEIKMGNLEWCFRPLLITLRIVGIDFKWNQQKSSVCKNLARLICLFWLVFNLATICGLASELYDSFSKVGQEKYKVISQKIKLSCLIVETAGVYAAFVFSTWKRGQKLVESFNQVEIYSEVDKKTYRKLRVTIIIGIVLSISTVK